MWFITRCFLWYIYLSTYINPNIYFCWRRNSCYAMSQPVAMRSSVWIHFLKNLGCEHMFPKPMPLLENFVFVFFFFHFVQLWLHCTCHLAITTLSLTNNTLCVFETTHSQFWQYLNNFEIFMSVNKSNELSSSNA